MLKPRLTQEIERFKASSTVLDRAKSAWKQHESGTFGKDGWSIRSSYKPLKDDDD